MYAEIEMMRECANERAELLCCLLPCGHGWDFKRSLTPVLFNVSLPKTGDHTPLGAPGLLDVPKHCHLPRIQH